MPRLFALRRTLTLTFGLLAVVALAHAEARADEVAISGFTNGCFNCVAPASTSATQSDTLLNLTYTNSTFFGTTADGFRGIGGSPSPPGVQGVNNLGSFTLATAANDYDGNTFTLLVTFTVPQGIDGSNSATFTAVLTGMVISDNIGGVRLDFDNTPILFTFDDPNCEPDPTGGIPGQQTTCGTGSFFFSVNDLAIDPGQTAALTGQITGAQQTIPEPATMILLGTGLAGVAAAARRRRLAAQV